MSMIETHPSSEMLMNYAMGNTKEAESLIISSHIAYCPICKAEVAKYESIGGFYLRNHEELKLTNSLWNKVLERVDGLDQDDKSTNYVDHKLKTSLSNDSIRIPSFLHHYIENNDNNLKLTSSIKPINNNLNNYKNRKKSPIFQI